jgi:hypothetical protein
MARARWCPFSERDPPIVRGSVESIQGTLCPETSAPLLTEKDRWANVEVAPKDRGIGCRPGGEEA